LWYTRSLSPVKFSVFVSSFGLINNCSLSGHVIYILLWTCFLFHPIYYIIHSFYFYVVFSLPQSCSMILSAYYHSRFLLLISTNNMVVSKLNSCYIISFRIALGNDFKITDLEELSICSAFSLQLCRRDSLSFSY